MELYIVIYCMQCNTLVPCKAWNRQLTVCCICTYVQMHLYDLMYCYYSLLHAITLPERGLLCYSVLYMASSPLSSVLSRLFLKATEPFLLP